MQKITRLFLRKSRSFSEQKTKSWFVINTLFLTAMLFFTNNANSQMVEYVIDNPKMLLGVNECRGNTREPSWTGGGKIGFMWNDDKLPKDAKISKIEVFFHMGTDDWFQSRTAPTRDIFLNGNQQKATAQYTNQRENASCDCIEQPAVTASIPDFSSYKVGGQNEFVLVDAKGAKMGFCMSLKDLGGAYAIVKVYYEDNSNDFELTKVAPVTKNSSLCRYSSYEVDVTIRNNGPGMGDKVDVKIDFPGANSFEGTVDVSSLKPKEERTFRVISSDYLTPIQAINKAELKATILNKDLDPKNNVISSYINVSNLPYGSEINPSSSFPGFPRLGNNIEPDYITYNKTYTYEITSPKAYSNADFGKTWNANLEIFINSLPLSQKLYTYTAPSAKENGSITFELDKSTLNAGISFVYTVTDLTGTGCDSTTMRYAIVKPTPEPSFNTQSSCEDKIVTFMNTSIIASGKMSYRWDFGDKKGNSTLFYPEYTYSTLGTYQVKLVATSDIGFIDSITIPVEISSTPVADFSFKNECGNLPISFTNKTSVGGNENLNYTWYFGNGTESNETSPNVIYSTPGEYPVILNVITDKGCESTVTKTIFSYPVPSADFDAPTSVCFGTPIQFDNHTTIEFSNWGSEWKFGENEGRTISNSPSYNFKTTGEKEVTLITTSQYGCQSTITKKIIILENPAPNIIVSNTCKSEVSVFNSNVIVPENMNATFNWNIDGELSSEENPIVTFNSVGLKLTTLKIDYSNGCSSEEEAQIEIGYKPVANFIVSNKVCSGEELNIANNSSIEQGTVVYTWLMGDGSVYNGYAPNHTYNNNTPSTYDITLIAQPKHGGCSDTMTQSVQVGLTPSCDFDVESYYVNGHRGYSFTAPEVEGASYEWYFGDGVYSQEQNPIYQFKRDGDFNVSLKITTPEGCDCNKTISHHVYNLGASNVFDNQTILVYPNPTSGIINIDNLDLSKVSSIKVVNMIGSTVYAHNVTEDGNSFSFDMSNFQNGTYMIMINTVEGQIITQSFVLVR